MSEEVCLEDQAAAIAFLKDPLTHGPATGAIKVIETHISMIFLVGGKAFKLKRAVRLPYVDFCGAHRRLAFCRKELDLNRRTAPSLYRAVRSITREPDGRLAFDGEGKLVDAVVEMVRFDEAASFDRLAGSHLLTVPLMRDLARVIANFHGSTPVDHSRSGSAGIAAVLAINERALATTKLFAPDAVAGFNAAFRASFVRHADLLDARERAGKVRRCHGDLHLANICLVDGRPTPFDCLEFDDGMATIDVLYDLAFLLMDLWHRGLRSHANLVLNIYLDGCDESDGLAFVPFFMALRAAVRAHVTATRASTMADADADAEPLRREARAYFDLALALLKPAPARLIAVGGFSGSGKSTLAAALADRIGPPPGARILASDRLRKGLYGVTAETRLPEDAYRSEISERVYSRIYATAAEILRQGYGVIADAVFDRQASRREIERVAKDANVPFTGLWLEAPPSTLIERVDARRNDASDADAEIVRLQLARDGSAIEWPRIAAGGLRTEAFAEAVALLDGIDQGTGA